jgi:site-specific DNA recombinase
MTFIHKNTPHLPAIIYARKSTDAKLEQEVNSISVQCASARSFIESQKNLGWYGLDEELIDNNVSGATMKRDGIERLKKLILEGKVKVVVVNRLDRISRSLSQFLELMTFFEKHDVSLVSVTQNINTSTPMGRLMLSIIMGFSEFERELICERVTERMHAARKNGQFIGGRPILGYNIKPEGRALEVDEVEAIRVREIFQLYLELRSIKAVVIELKKRDWKNKQWVTREGKITGGSAFTTSTLHNLLQNLIYIGKVTLKGKIYEGQHEGIIDPDIFARVQALRTDNDVQKGNRNRNRHDALLKGLLTCKSCGTAFIHTGTKKKSKYYRYYTCANKRLYGAHVCPSPSIPAGEIENLVTEQLFSIGTKPELQEMVYRQLVETLENKQVASTHAHKTATKQLNRITKELASAREFGASESLILHLEQKRQEAENALENAEKKGAWCKPSKNKVLAVIRDMAGLWPTFNTGEKCAFIKTLIQQVEYDALEGSITLHFNDEGFAATALEGGEA